MKLSEYKKLTKKKPKYRNTKTVVDGIKFDSKKEAARYGQLKFLEKHGKITDLVLQPKFRITIGGVFVCGYIADFYYKIPGQNMPVIEDCKGFKTPIYRIKKKLMKAVWKIEIVET